MVAQIYTQRLVTLPNLHVLQLLVNSNHRPRTRSACFSFSARAVLTDGQTDKSRSVMSLFYSAARNKLLSVLLVASML